MSLEKPLEVFVKPKQRRLGGDFTAEASVFAGDDRLAAETMADGVLIGCIWFPDLDVAAQRLMSRFPGDWIWSEPLIQFRREKVKYGDRFREIVLEPFLLVTVTTPPDYVGHVIGDLSSRRAMITEQHECDGMIVVAAEAPLEQLSQYISTLAAITSGKASAEATFLNYQKRPYYLDPPPDEPMSAALRA